MRVEFRSLPAGPTVVDMIANAAFAVGFTLGLEDSIDLYIARIPFRFVEYNFYRAAQHGLDARLIWPHSERGGFKERPILDIIEEFLPLVYRGLLRLKLSSDEIDRLWKIIEERFDKRMTGAKWQLNRFEHYRQSCSVAESCHRMLLDYQDNMIKGHQVASWD